MSSLLAKQLEQFEYETGNGEGLKNIEIRLGQKRDWGFYYNIPENHYYSLYSFFFYQNEWIERIFDTYHIFNQRHGENMIRVNDDGFKFRNDYYLTKMAVIQKFFDCDFQICVYSMQTQITDKKSLMNCNLFSQDVTRYCVDEIVLKYSDHLAIVFTKTVNLKNMSITFSVKISINPFPLPHAPLGPHTSLTLPSGKQIIKILVEMDECVKLCGHPDGFHGIDNTLYRQIASQTDKKMAKDIDKAALPSINQDLYRPAINKS